MPRVCFTAHLRQHSQCEDRDVPGETVRAALEHIFKSAPALRGYILDDQQSLRPHVAIFVSGRTIVDRIGLSDPVAAGDEVYVLQALSGG